VAEAHNHEDVDLSAFKQVCRPEFERLLEDHEASLLAGVICWKLDRLTRSHRGPRAAVGDHGVAQRQAGGFTRWV
jgi:DNA invertase Pin-like site-specific DNA recombinase